VSDTNDELEGWYRRYGPMVLRRCRRLLRDEEAALDALQEVFLNLARRPKRDRAQSPASLLHTIATRVCLNRLRGLRRHPVGELDEQLLAIAQAGEDLERRWTVRSLVDRVFGREPPSTRTIAVLHWVDGMTLEEVAAEVGMSVSGVRKRLRTLRARVAQTEEQP
jgi:RNA polymerase sigma factor (sigma-70 family)